MDGYLEKTRALCDKNNIVFVLDEIQTGLGRTGKLFAYQYENMKPDMLVLGKALGGGVIPVSMVVGSKEVTLDWDKFSLAFDGDPEVDVYHNEMALPRAFVVHQATVAADHEDAWTQIQEPGFDPATTVVLEGGNAVDLQQAVQASVEVVRYEPNVVEIEVDSEAEGYLFLSDPYYPGWRAEVDGEPATILRANYAFRAVAVPAGSHRVTMAFRPGTWYAGLGISVFTAAVLLILGVWVVLRRGRRET